MKNILYLECYSGISGDMTIGALLDLGADRQALEKAFDSLGLEGYHLHFGRTKKCGIDAFDFDVHLESGHDHHDHSHDHEHDHSHDHDHDHDHAHSHHDHDHHDYDHEHDHSHDHDHHHRNINDIYKLIDKLQASDKVKNLAVKIFDIVAEAESKAHGIPREEVHFHEVGAIDSILDIIGTAVCLDSLGVDEVIVSPLSEGRGFVRCQHGVMPVPVPAVANITQSHGIQLMLTDNEGEMVTPTGAAIAAALHSGKKLPKQYKIRKIGLGAGKKDFKNANILRAMFIEAETCADTGLNGQSEGIQPREETDSMWKLETNIDDCGGEALGFVMEYLLEAGAADVWYTPIYMKKNRPAYMLSVLCSSEKTERMEDIIFAHTTTVGIRRTAVQRRVLERKIVKVETPLGAVDVKVCRHKEKIYYYPEYESVKKICTETGREFQAVYLDIISACSDNAIGK